MFKVKEIKAIARRLNRSGLECIEIKKGDYSLKMTCVPGQTPPSTDEITRTEPTVEVSPSLQVHTVEIPAPGRIWLQDPLTGKNIATDGEQVKVGDLLALLQMGPIQLPVRADANGTLALCSLQQGDRVEYSQPMAHITITGDN